MGYKFKKAERQNSKVLIGLYGESGCGKTMSSLMLARGLVGENGKIAMIDTEQGRGELYADVITGGYDTMQMQAPFSPQNYIGAIDAAEQAGYDAIVIDSASHEWEGIGGVLDMAAQNEERTKKAGLHNWKTPKLEHQKFMQRLLASNMHLIVNLRAKYKSRQVYEKGKSKVVKDDFASPIQAEDFIFEMTAHMEILQNHCIRITKCSHPELVKCFENGKAITYQTGVNIADWCASGSKPDPKKEAEKPQNQDLINLCKAIKSEILDASDAIILDDVWSSRQSDLDKIKSENEQYYNMLNDEYGAKEKSFVF